jgi:ATP-dependent RNA helicase MRH4
MTRLVTPNLHRLPSTLSLGKVRWSGGNWRADILLEIRRAFVEDAQNGHMDSQIIVFINKNVKAEDFGQYLTEYGVPSVTLTGESKNRGRGHSMAINPFLTQPKYQTSASAWSKRQQAKEEVDPALPPVEYKPPPPGPRVLVTTGLLSRGLDFSPKVKTIIITDEPRNAVDFIHRAGRAGRAGAGGRVIIFTGDGEKRSLHRMGGGKGRGGAIYKTVRPTFLFTDPCLVRA